MNLPRSHRLSSLAHRAMNGSWENPNKFCYFHQVCTLLSEIHDDELSNSIGTPLFKSKLKNYYLDQQTIIWSNMQAGRYLREIKPRWNPLSKYATSNGTRFGEITRARLRTGWSFLNDTRSRMKLGDDKCPSCGAPESRRHLLLECHTFNAVRQKMLLHVRASLPVSMVDRPIDCVCLLGGWRLSARRQAAITDSVDEFICSSGRLAARRFLPR